MVTMMAMADERVIQSYVKQPPDSGATLCNLRASVLVVVAASLKNDRMGGMYRCKTAAALAPKLIELMSSRCECCAPVTQPGAPETSCCCSAPPPTHSAVDEVPIARLPGITNP